METCYRHPNRETGVRCSNCERPICPDCMTTTPVGMRCPECARQRTKDAQIRSPSDEPTLTYILIGINVLVALGGILGGASATGGGIGGSSLLQDGAVSRAEIADGEYWRLVTAGFLHAGFFHLLFNMLSLYILGGLLEPAVGRLRFGLIYFVSLLAGSFGALMLEPDAPTVGASGAIFGLMGATAVVDAQPRDEHHGERARHLDRAEPGDHVQRPEHLRGRPHRRPHRGALTAFVLVELGDRVRVPEGVLALVCGALGAAAVAGAIVVSSSA